MRTPPRANRCQKILDEITKLLEYFLTDTQELDILKQDIRYLRDYINEVSEEKKLTEIKLAAKIKKNLESDDATISNEDSSEEDSTKENN